MTNCAVVETGGIYNETTNNTNTNIPCWLGLVVGMCVTGLCLSEGLYVSNLRCGCSAAGVAGMGCTCACFFDGSLRL